MTETTKKIKPKAKPMKVIGRNYASVSDLVRDTSDAAFADEFDKHLSDHRLVNSLVVLRCIKRLSQTKLAGKMGCGQPKVSKLEASADADLNFGDFLSYAQAVGQTIRIMLTPGRANGSDHVRFYAACLKHELDRLVNVAGDDTMIGDGVERFAIETMRALVAMIEDSIDKLPRRIDQAGSPMSVEVEGDRGQRLPHDFPKRVRKPSRKTAPKT